MRTAWLPSASARPPPRIARRTRASTGSARKATSGAVRIDQPRLASAGRSRWRKEPELRQRGESVRPRQPVEEGMRLGRVGATRATTTPAYVAGTLAARRDLDRPDAVRRRRVGGVDDGRIAFAELDLGDDRLDVLLLRDDVRGVAVGEAGRIAGLGRRDWRSPAPRRSVIGTSSPAAMTLMPGAPGPPASRCRPDCPTGTMIVSTLPAKATAAPSASRRRRASGGSSVGREEHVGRRALLDLGAQGGRRVGRDRQRHAGRGRLVGGLRPPPRASLSDAAP